MSIQKITRTEIEQNGVKSLPTRPSTPTLYTGKTMSAEELKEAFDKLPTLIAERFNALLESTGLFDNESPADSLAALIATDLFPAHSLKTFFEDVRNGNLALYLNADAEKSLADVLSELRADLSALTMEYSVSVTGEGDLVTDAEMQGKSLLLHKGVKRKDIVAEANAYTDARTRALENAGKGILYSYPVVEAEGAYTQVDENALESTALLSFGAIPPEKENILPEAILSTYKGESLSVVWDSEKGELVLNGTLRAADSPLRLAPFKAPVPIRRMCLASFYRGGRVSTNTVKISAVDENGGSVKAALLEGDSLEYGSCTNRFSHIALSVTEDTVFENYRFNLLLAKEQYSAVSYVPFSSGFGFTLPRKLIAQSPNMWTGGVLTGETYVTFPLPPLPKVACFMIGMHPRFSYEAKKPYGMMRFYYKGKEVYSLRARGNSFKSYFVEYLEPFDEIRVYAKETNEESVGHTIVLDKLYISFCHYWNVINTLTYEKGARYELTLPDTFSRFDARFTGINGTENNYFDFETGEFIEKTALITVDGSLAFEAVEGTPGRFSAPFATPSDILERDNYLPSALFQAKTSDAFDECLWFDAERVYIQSSMLENATASEVKALLSLLPIEVVYRTDSMVYTQLFAGEEAFFEPPLFRVSPRAYVYFSTDGADAIAASTKIQYQIKETV